MKIGKIFGNTLLTLVYPFIHFTVIKALDQLGSTETGFFEGVKNIWKGDEKCTGK